MHNSTAFPEGQDSRAAEHRICHSTTVLQYAKSIAKNTLCSTQVTLKCNFCSRQGPDNLGEFYEVRVLINDPQMYLQLSQFKFLYFFFQNKVSFQKSSIKFSLRSAAIHLAALGWTPGPISAKGSLPAAPRPAAVQLAE